MTLRTLALAGISTLALAACGGSEVEDDAVVITDDTAVVADRDAMDDARATADTGMDDMDGMDMDDDDTMMAGDAGGMGDTGMVTVTVTGVTPNAGTVYVGLQNSGNFGSLDVTQGGTAEPTGDSVEVMIEDVPSGSYAVVAFQDTDGNGTTTLGPTGPAEPWGIAGYEGGAPDPMNAMMNVAETGEATVSLRN